jgi:succinyl-CoA synthetase alpha subunit
LQLTTDHRQWTNFKEPFTNVTLDLIQVNFFGQKEENIVAILADQNTRVIVQGITGREATGFTKDMVNYGTQVVAGVTPGKQGQQVHGIPVFDTVRRALKEHPAEASVISVPPALVKGAVLEALDNGIQLLVVVAERVPRKDTIEFLEVARGKGARVIGPNTLGFISPHRLKLGMAGGPVEDVEKAYMPGPVGIASRSGGMTTEIANLLTTQGIGQSTCIGVGGDPVVGSNFLDLIPLFDEDPETKALVLFCEPGGIIEEKLAEFVMAENILLPIVAFIAGRFVDNMPGVRFGHAATIVEGDRGTTKGKIAMFKKTGVRVAESFSDIAVMVREYL